MEAMIAIISHQKTKPSLIEINKEAFEAVGIIVNDAPPLPDLALPSVGDAPATPVDTAAPAPTPLPATTADSAPALPSVVDPPATPVDSAAPALPPLPATTADSAPALPSVGDAPATSVDSAAPATATVTVTLGTKEAEVVMTSAFPPSTEAVVISRNEKQTKASECVAATAPFAKRLLTFGCKYINPAVKQYYIQLHCEAQLGVCVHPPPDTEIVDMPKELVLTIMHTIRINMMVDYGFEEVNLLYHLIHYGMVPCPDKQRFLSKLTSMTFLGRRIQVLHEASIGKRLWKSLKDEIKDPSTRRSLIASALSYGITQGIRHVVMAATEGAVDIDSWEKTAKFMIEHMHALEVNVVETSDVVYAMEQACLLVVDAVQVGIISNAQTVAATAIQAAGEVIAYGGATMTDTSLGRDKKTQVDSDKSLKKFFGKITSILGAEKECYANSDCFVKFYDAEVGESSRDHSKLVCNTTPSGAKVGRITGTVVAIITVGLLTPIIPVAPGFAILAAIGFAVGKAVGRKMISTSVTYVYQQTVIGAEAGDNTCGPRRFISEYCRFNSDCASHNCHRSRCACNLSPLSKEEAIELQTADLELIDLVKRTGCEAGQIAPIDAQGNVIARSQVGLLAYRADATFLTRWLRENKQSIQLANGYVCLRHGGPTGASSAPPTCYLSPSAGGALKTGRQICGQSEDCAPVGEQRGCCKARADGYNHCSSSDHETGASVAKQMKNGLKNLVRRSEWLSSVFLGECFNP